MKIELTHDWMGHKPGAVLNLMPIVAYEMINRGVAKHYEEAPNNKEIKSPQSTKELKFKGGNR